MKLTKKHLKKIIREEYSRLKRRGLIKEYGYELDDGLGNYPGDEGYSQMEDEWSYWGQKACYQEAYESALEILEQNPEANLLDDEEMKQEFVEAWMGEMPMTSEYEIMEQWFEGTRQAMRDGK